MRSLAPACAMLLAVCGCSNDQPDDQANPVRAPQPPRVLPAQEALSTPNIATLDPSPMDVAEVVKVLGRDSWCAFKYVSDGEPVFAWTDAGTGVVKLNGSLVQLETSGSNSGRFAAEPIRINVTPSTSRAEEEATLLFEVADKLRVGYGGYSGCSSGSSR